MTILRPVTVLWMLAACCPAAAPAGQGASPDRSLLWTAEPSDGGVVLTVKERTSRNPPVNAGTFPGPQIDVLISPDNRLLAVQPATPAPRQDVRILTRSADGSIAPHAGPDPAAALESAAFAALGVSAGSLTKRTVTAVHWSAAGESLVLSLSGGGSGVTFVAWTAQLDLATGKVTPLPAPFNDQAAIRWPEDNTPDAVPYAKLGYADNRFTLDGTPFTGVTTDHYPHGSLRRRYQIREGVFDGLVEEWYDTGRPKARTAYAGGKHNGDNIYWNPDGTLQVRKVWKDDVLLSEEKP